MSESDNWFCKDFSSKRISVSITRSRKENENELFSSSDYHPYLLFCYNIFRNNLTLKQNTISRYIKDFYFRKVKSITIINFGEIFLLENTFR